MGSLVTFLPRGVSADDFGVFLQHECMCLKMVPEACRPKDEMVFISQVTRCKKQKQWLVNKLYKLPLGIFIAIRVKIEGIKIQLNTKEKALNEHN